MDISAILTMLKQLGSHQVKKIKEGFAIKAEPSYGIFLKDLQTLAKRIGKSDALALALFDTEVYEARLLCRMLFDQKHITEDLMEKWVSSFENWEICDTYCMGFLGKSRYAVKKAFEWTEREAEFQKRAGFVLMVSHAFTHREADNETFQQFFPLLIHHANDPRTYVMKGINWALRQIGKRNSDLRKEALEVAEQILALGTKSARWIAKDGIRELKSSSISMKNYPKRIYGKKEQ